jgi:hypothetical protein
MHRERINLEMSVPDAAMALVEGNPGAVNVVVQMTTKGRKIDPDSAFGDLSGLISLDTQGIYGPRIWMLYKDVCKEDIVITLGLLRAVQLGLLSNRELQHAIDNYGEGIDVEDLLTKVKERLPNFGKEED